jgi:adenylate kinase family enzyme
MDRVLISGISGSGKTTLAATVSALLGLPRFELDALHHGPGWVKRADFETDVDAFSAGSRWVTEDQYHTALGDLLWQRADTVIWLDLPRRTVMQRVIRRSAGRAITRRELWNGNRESIRDWLDPEHPIRWAWSRHGSRRREITARIARHPQISVIRLHSGRDARRWLNELRANSPPGTPLPSSPSS